MLIFWNISVITVSIATFYYLSCIWNLSYLIIPNTRRTLFADDFQTSMDDLTLFNADHRIILSCTKSVRVLFERQNSTNLKPQDATYNGKVIPSIYLCSRRKNPSFALPLTPLSPSNRTFVTSPILHILNMSSSLLFNLWPFYIYLHPPSQILHSFIDWLRCASHLRRLSQCSTYLGDDTNQLREHFPFHHSSTTTGHGNSFTVHPSVAEPCT